MNRSCCRVTTGKSCEARVVAYRALSFWKARFMKGLLALFPFSNGLGTSLLLSCVKNLVIDNGGRWFVYSKRRLLKQHISDFFCKCDQAPFPIFWGGAWGRGYIPPSNMGIPIWQSKARITTTGFFCSFMHFHFHLCVRPTWVISHPDFCRFTCGQWCITITMNLIISTINI